MLGAPCSPCCGRCISFKSVGWEGRIVDYDSQHPTGSFINSDGYQTAAGSSFEPPLSFSWLNFRNFVSLRIDVLASVVRATLTIDNIPGLNGTVVLESDQVEPLLNGEVIHVAEVISNTVPTTLDEYNEQLIRKVGSFYVKRDFVSGCACSCSPNAFDSSRPLVTPETYTLQFTNTQARPAGPRWPNPGALNSAGVFGAEYSVGRYAGFLPPGSWASTVNQQVVVRAGCDSHMARFAQPIVLRKVSGTFYTYMSDPILLRPCVQVRYTFVSCSVDGSPKLSAAVLQSGAHPSATVSTPRPLCVWNAEGFIQLPETYEEHVNSFVYNFGDFATVTPGGEYTPETHLDCGYSADPNLSLMEGCLGAACPPEEIELEIKGSGPELAIDGTYALQLDFAQCSPIQYPGQLTFFNGTRVVYRGNFVIAGLNFVFQITRHETSNIFPAFVSRDDCGCESRLVDLFVQFTHPTLTPGQFSGSTNVPVRASSQRCQPICSDGTRQSVWQDIILQVTQAFVPSQFWSIGNVTMRF